VAISLTNTTPPLESNPSHSSESSEPVTVIETSHLPAEVETSPEIPDTTLSENISPFEHTSKRYLVGLNNTEESTWAFNVAVLQMDKQKDELYLLTISPHRISDEKATNKLLVLPRFARIAEKYQVRNVKLIVGHYKDVPEAICKISAEYNINYLFLGHKRNVRFLQRFSSLSTTRFCEENSKSSVTIVKSPTTLPPLAEEEAEEEPEEEVAVELLKKITYHHSTYMMTVLLE